VTPGNDLRNRAERSLLLVIVAAESNQSSSGKPVNHSSNADDCDDGRNHIRDDIQHAGENSNAQKAEARDERYPADLICSPRPVPLRRAPDDTQDQRLDDPPYDSPEWDHAFRPFSEKVEAVSALGGRAPDDQ
jgi:hypothetical protein